LQKYNIGLLA